MTVALENCISLTHSCGPGRHKFLAKFPDNLGLPGLVSSCPGQSKPNRPLAAVRSVGAASTGSLQEAVQLLQQASARGIAHPGSGSNYHIV